MKTVFFPGVDLKGVKNDTKLLKWSFMAFALVFLINNH